MLKKDDQVWELEAIPAGSRFNMIEEVDMPWGIIGKAMDKLFVGRGVAKHIEELIGNLEALVEAEK
jgi:hypothetical protein